ncbi:hypothetical protein AVEN_165707-1 [Araneus ventricosus]|uniref:DUF4817 domain-containing protein n=1 Tax=Araneus ventricosus TaxID=182803 RepID=A0A4Y2C540_ARAVE|nr:hypothetical protein AVEN_165707-1 [Araneus ventricosus]
MPGRLRRMVSRWPSDYFLLPRLKEHLSGTRFSSNNDVKTGAKNWFNRQGRDFCQAELNKNQHIRKFNDKRDNSYAQQYSLWFVRCSGDGVGRLRPSSRVQSSVWQRNGYSGKDLATLNCGWMTRTTPNLAPPLQTPATHQREDIWSPTELTSKRPKYIADLQWNRDSSLEPSSSKTRPFHETTAAVPRDI